MIKSLLGKVLERNLLLFEDHRRFTVVTVVRLLGLFGLVFIVKTASAWDGTFPATDREFWIALLLALFSVALASAFYVSAVRAARQSSAELRKVLVVLQHQQRDLIVKLDSPVDRRQSERLPEPSTAGPKERAHPAEELELMDRLLSDDAAKQLLIALYEGRRRFPWQPESMIDYAFQTREGSWQSGSTDLDGVGRRLSWTGLLSRGTQGELALTRQGQVFAKWLIDTGNKAPWFASNLANWGDPPPQEQWPFFRENSAAAQHGFGDNGYEISQEVLY